MSEPIVSGAAIRARLGEGISEFAVSESGDLSLEVLPEALTRVATGLRDDPELLLDYPADMAARDTGDELILWVRLWSMTHGRGAEITVRMQRDEPHVPSLTPVWAGLNWHERECYDLFGIYFDGHPGEHDMSRMRILLPRDWEGHTFRKDYVPVFSGDPLHGPQETN